MPDDLSHVPEASTAIEPKVGHEGLDVTSATTSPYLGKEAVTAPAATTQVQRTIVWDFLVDDILRVAVEASDEIFEDGIYNLVSHNIQHLVLRYGKAALDALDKAYLSRSLPDRILSESLLWLGRLDHPASHEARYAMFLYYLREIDLTIKSSAALALGSLGDPRAAPFLQREAENMNVPLLKREFELLASELQP